MKKIKGVRNLLSVLLIMIVSLGSITVVKAETENDLYENQENVTLIQKEYLDLDEDTIVEIETYEEELPAVARSAWKTKNGTRTYRIINKQTNTVFVRYILKGTFRYNGKTAECTNATYECKVFVPNVYKVITKRAEKGGSIAWGYFYCTHIKNGNSMGGTFSISCSATGTLTIN